MAQSGVGRELAPATGQFVFHAKFARCVALSLAALFWIPTQAFAQQALERNLPAPVGRSGNAFSIGAADYGKADDTPLGINLSGVRLIGQADKVVPAAGGISFGSVPTVDRASVDHALSPFMGKPITRALIAQMQADVAAIWRRAGYPFVSVTLPPQEVTSGVLSLRVIEFRAGEIRTNADAAIYNQSLPGRLRVKTGDRIEAGALREDLDWINRNPYRRVQGVFAPGDAQGTSDITLSVTEQKPFSVFGSWSNTGSDATGLERWSVGGGAWLPWLNDATITYRFTRSEDFWQNGQIFSLDDDEGSYLSHAGRLDLPTWSRQAISIAPNYVETNELSGPFSFRNKTFELPILYRTAISNIAPGNYWGDLYFGVEPKWLSRDTSFFGTKVADADVALFNFVLGWADDWTDAYGATSLDIRIKGNPGGILDGNSRADWNSFTGGRVTDNTYLHAGFDLTRTTTLPQDFAWVAQVSGLIAGQALPDTERLGLGGFYSVRGYGSESGSVDTGFVWRNELRLPALHPLQQAGIGDTLSPFFFADLGHGYDFATKDTVTIGGAGFGLDYDIATNFNASLIAAVALADADETRAGDWSFRANLRVSY